MYAAFGVASPFLPAFVHARGLPPAQLGLVLAAGTAIQMLSAPLAGRIGDLIQDLRRVLVLCLLLSALMVLAYLGAHGLTSFLLITLLRSLALAPITVLADALALGTSARRATEPARFDYAWVRGSGSAAFIAGTLASGQLIGSFGLSSIIASQAVLLSAAMVAALCVPRLQATPASDAVRAPAGGVLVLLRSRSFRTLVLAAALVLGSHAMHDGFAVIRWRAAGISPALASVLWSESVAAEVVVFFVIGPALIRRLSPTGAIALAAGAAALRWVVMALTADVVALCLIQPLHGITFALLHLSCMRVIAQIVPPGLEGTAQALYGTIGIGSANALLTLASGWLYGRLGAPGFAVMALLCVVALPVTLRLRGLLAAPDSGASLRTTI